MAMNQKTRSLVMLGVLVAVAGGAGLFAYYGVHVKQEADKKSKDEQQKLFAVDKAKVKGLTVTAKNQTTILARAEGGEGWLVVSPVNAGADTSTVDALLDRLLQLRSKMVVEEKAQDLAKFGLDRPTLKVVARLDDGKELVLRAGAENSFDSSVYVAIGDSNDVLQAEGGFKWALEKDTFDLRDKRVMPFEDAQVRELQVRVDSNRFALQKADTGWQLVSPMTDRADEVAVNRVLGTLRNLRAARYVTETATPTEDATYGLNNPRLEATVVLDGGQRMTLVAHQREEDGPTAHARRRDAIFIAEVPEAVFSELNVKLEDLRDKSVLRYDKDAVFAVQFGFGEESVTLERSRPTDSAATDDWKITAPAKADAKRWKITSMLWTLSSLKADGIADENPTDLAQYGLDKPARRVVLSGLENKELASLAIGREDGENVFLKNSADKRVFRIAKTKLHDVPASRGDIEEKPAAAKAAEPTPASQETPAAPATP